MISSRMFTTPIPARQAKALLIAYTIRHIFGGLVFGWMVFALKSVGEGQWVTLLCIGLAYLAFAVYNGRKLWNLYKKRLASEQRQK